MKEQVTLVLMSCEEIELKCNYICRSVKYYTLISFTKS